MARCALRVVARTLTGGYEIRSHDALFTWPALRRETCGKRSIARKAGCAGVLAVSVLQAFIACAGTGVDAGIVDARFTIQAE